MAQLQLNVEAQNQWMEFLPGHWSEKPTAMSWIFSNDYKQNHKLMMLLKLPDLVIHDMRTILNHSGPYSHFQKALTSCNIQVLTSFEALQSHHWAGPTCWTNCHINYNTTMSNSINMSMINNKTKDHTNIITSASISGAPGQQAIVWLPISIWLPCLTQEPGCHGPRRSLKAILRYW